MVILEFYRLDIYAILSHFLVDADSYGVEVFKFVYPDGFYFVVATDVAAVEVQTRPLKI